MTSCSAFLPVSLTPVSADEPAPRKSYSPQAIAELAEANRATKPAEIDDGPALLFMHGGAWVRWAHRPAIIPAQGNE
jgi:acetyl esterase/lipase